MPEIPDITDSLKRIAAALEAMQDMLRQSMQEEQAYKADLEQTREVLRDA